MNTTHYFFISLVSFLLLHTVGLHAQPLELNPAQREYLLQKAAELQATARKEMQMNQSTAIGFLNRAANHADAALDLYLEAVERVDFKQEGKKESDFREWRDNRQDQFRDDAFKQALQLQAQYILLTMEVMQSKSNEDLERIVPKVVTYAGRVTALQPLDRRHILNRSLESTYLVRHMGIHTSNNLNRAWVMKPGDTQKMYDSFVFPTIIKLNNSELLQEAWEARMGQERTLAQKMNALAKFNSHRLLELYWQRAKDYHALGDLENGLLSMLSLLQNNTQHPRALEWSEEFQALIENSTRP